MKKTISKIKFNLIRGAILGICLTLIFSITAFGKSNDVQLLTVQSQKTINENTLMQKQQEIDKYLFEQHAKEIEQKGFKVTHTGIVNNYVEIGITPFSEENADYLYTIFGNDKVKVIGGEQAVLMNTAVNDTKASSTNPLIYAIIGVAILGTVVFIIQKRKPLK